MSTVLSPFPLPAPFQCLPVSLSPFSVAHMYACLELVICFFKTFFFIFNSVYVSVSVCHVCSGAAGSLILEGICALELEFYAVVSSSNVGAGS